MTNKLELKSSHEVIDTVDVADVESIFYCKPTDPDILTVLMKDGKRLYCDEVCPLQEKPVSEDLEEEALVYSASDIITEDGKLVIDSEKVNAFKAGAKWQKEQMMAKAIDGVVLENYDGKVLKYDDLILDEKLSNCNVFDKVKIIVVKED